MTGQELLFEIGSEEIPAGYIVPALNHLQNELAARLTAQALSFGPISGVATPRRLTVRVEGLSPRQPDRVEELLGPPKQAAFDPQGQPTKAALGFAQSKGVAMEALQVVTTAKGEYLLAKIEQPGRATGDILAELLPELITAIPFPKSMRWGAGRLHFARPIQWLLAIYGGETVNFNLDGLAAGRTTRGHRFHAPASREVNSFAHYLDTLRQAEVLADPAERRTALLAEIHRAAQAAGGAILPDEELVETVTNLVESPHAICGRFDPRFLALPRAVLITSMREHQKYFAVVDAAGELLPRFVAVNNTKVKDEQVGADGHQRVLRARLEDALFFFRQDQEIPLADRVEALQGVLFQAKLGTMREKTARLAQLAGSLAELLAPAEAAAVRRAAHLAKADLLTDMVGEFPTLQGLVGRDYARLQGESEAVATAIHEHYLPLRAGGELPTGKAGAIVGIADRLDTLAGCFGIGLKPTGTTDPFGLRRQALGLIHLMLANEFELPLVAWIDQTLALYRDKLGAPEPAVRERLLEFLKGRFANDLIGRGIAAETVEAVTSVAFDDLTDCRRRIEALHAISVQPAFPLLAAAFKRVNNIIKEEREQSVDPKLFSEEAEQKLQAALARAATDAAPLLASRDYQGALAVILTMKEPVDQFFDQVMVMAEDEKVRRNRMALLARVAALFLRVGDFSKMYAL